MTNRMSIIVRNSILAIFLSIFSPGMVAQIVESNVSGHCLDVRFPANPFEMVPGEVLEECTVVGKVFGDPGSEYAANATAIGETYYGYTGNEQGGVGIAQVKVRSEVIPISSTTGNAVADATAIIEYYAGIVVAKPPPIPLNLLHIKLDGIYGGYGFGSLSGWGANIRLTKWDELNVVVDAHLPTLGTPWPPTDPDNPQLHREHYTLKANVIPSAVYQIHVEAWCNATASIQFVRKAGCEAYADPILSFDQAAFDAEMGADTFNLDEYYQFVYSPVPIPPTVWLFGSGLLGLIGIARKKSAQNLAA